MRKVIYVALMVFLFVWIFSPVIYAEKPFNSKKKYSELKKIEQFGIIKVDFQGTAKVVGLDRSEITDYAKLMYKNNFADVPYVKENYETTPIEKIGTIFITIWTVGSEGIVAYHASIDGGLLMGDLDIYETAYLGYTNIVSLEGQIKSCISKLMEDFATFFFKARGEL